MNEITIPKRLRPIIQAFMAQNEKAAKALILSAVRTIRSDSSKVSAEEIEAVLSLMKALDPKDMIEMIYGAQIVSSHLLGLKLLGQDFTNDQILGLKLLKFSNEALSQLQKKRTGGTNQNINITYNLGEGPALMQTILASQKSDQCQ